MIIRLNDAYATLITSDDEFIYKPQNSDELVISKNDAEYGLVHALVHIIVQMNEELDTQFNNVADIVDIEE